MIATSLLSVNNEEDAITWYKDKHPTLPDGMAEIFAKYHFGEKQEEDKKERQDKLKKRRKKKKALNKLKVRQGKFKVDFN